MSTVHNGHAQGSQLARHTEQFHHTSHARPGDPAALHSASLADGPVRVLLVNGAPRSDGSWAGEAAKTWRLTELARETLHAAGAAAQVLDLGLLPESDGARAGWAAAVREQWLAAHAIIVVAPAQGDALDGMRAVLAQPGTRELLAERAYGIVVHGDMAALCQARAELADWLDGLGLIATDSFGPLNKFVGYYEPDEEGRPAGADPVDEEEVQNVARAVHKAVTELRAGRVTGVGGAP